MTADAPAGRHSADPPVSTEPTAPAGGVHVIDGMSSHVACHRCGAYHDQRDHCPRCGR